MRETITKHLKKLLLSTLFIGAIAFSFGQNIKGKAFDAKTGEPLVGATVQLKNTKYTTAVNLDGSFIFKNVKPGKYDILISLVDYTTAKAEDVNVSNTGTTTIPDFQIQPDSKDMAEVTVVGGADKGSDKAARNIEKNSDIVQNILSEKTIQLLPDVTVANALQRVSGVTIQKDNSGEGRYAIIRGMAQRYNNTLVNGIKIPSPDDKYRFVPMDIFPSEMLERLEVIKALTPSMEGDAIGGTMNLVMKSAPDRFLLSANIAGGYSTLFSERLFSAFGHSAINKKSPAEINGNSYQATATDFPLDNLHFHDKSSPVNGTFGMTIGDRFLNKKLGVILSTSYQNFYRGSNSQFLVPSAQPNYTGAGNTPNFDQAYERQYSTQTNRVGIQNKIDYKLNSRNKISLFNLYIHQNDFQSRFTPDTTVGTNSSSSSKSVDVSYRSRWQIQDIYNATLQGDHQLSEKVKLNWSAVYSIAKNQVPDMADYDFNANVLLDNSGKVTHIDSTTYGTNMSRTWQRNKDRDLAGYLNVTYTPTIFNKLVEFEAGGLYRAKTRDNYKNDYNLKAFSTTAMPFHTIDQVVLAFSPVSTSTGNVTAVNFSTYTAHENIAAAYLQTKFMVLKKLQLLGGVRVENTQQDYTTVMPITADARSGTINYVDVLPSVHFKYLLKPNQNIRLSYFKSISRPGFGEIVPVDNSDEQFRQIGNPYLMHVRADNIDLRYELFPGHADQLLLGAFYKKLQNPIEYFLQRTGPSAQSIQPGNVSSATNFGFEAVFTKYFGQFGVSANYTYTNSNVTTNKNLYHTVPVAGGGTTIVTDILSQKRPLQGQADNVGNLSLLYKNPNIGLEMQLAFSYTGTRIAQVSQYYNLDIWQKPISQLDFSLEKKLGKRFAFYTKINNLTNQASRYYIKAAPPVYGTYTLPYQTETNNTIVQRNMNKLSFLGGFRFKF